MTAAIKCFMAIRPFNLQHTSNVSQTASAVITGSFVMINRSHAVYITVLFKNEQSPLCAYEQ